MIKIIIFEIIAKIHTEMFESKIFHDIVMSSYLKPISEQHHQSKHNKLSHTNENKLMNNLIKDGDKLLELF